MQEKLIRVWKNCKTKQFAKIFEQYMKSNGIEKHDSRIKNNSNTYLIDGKSTNWNRVQCYYHKGNVKWGNENLLLVLRKEAGNYFIVSKQSKRAFEVDSEGIRSYDEDLLKEIIEEHKLLFDLLFEV